MSLFSILFYLLLVDALIANWLSWTGKQHWWQEHFGSLAQHLPLARGWTLMYLILVIVLGIVLHQSDKLVVPF